MGWGGAGTFRKTKAEETEGASKYNRIRVLARFLRGFTLSETAGRHSSRHLARRGKGGLIAFVRNIHPPKRSKWK